MNDPRMPTLAELQADLDASDAEIEAGQIVPAEVVRQLFHDTLARMEAKKTATLKREAASRR
ncbi:MAG TPA: hypothetical protein VH722_21720 [Alphaproteobacteria bacterium]|jgi:DNA recombination-dependent growth factor C|nr:hypothetical protein [Alphaproteobacteria bacterium]